jgi:hypothetical protein
MINVEEKKAKIVEVMQLKGPMLPIQVARDIELSTLFASAILSEMISNKILRVSNLKVGGSPLYYLPGQEPQLERFSNYLGQKEKETLIILKEKQLIRDDLLEPANRVAIRSIKDFAIPLKVPINNEEKIFWRFLTLSSEEAIKKIKEISKQKIVKIEEKKEEVKIVEKPAVAEHKSKPIILKNDEGFSKKIEEYIKKNDIKIAQEIERKKKDLLYRAKINSSVGEIEMLIIAKDKKTITENDLNLALGKGQGMKLPVLFLSNGKLNKKATSEIEMFKSYLIFREI